MKGAFFYFTLLFFVFATSLSSANGVDFLAQCQVIDDPNSIGSALANFDNRIGQYRMTGTLYCGTQGIWKFSMLCSPGPAGTTPDIMLVAPQAGFFTVHPQCVYFPGGGIGEEVSSFSTLEQISVVGGGGAPRQPGFEAVFAVAGLLAVAWLVNKRKR